MREQQFLELQEGPVEEIYVENGGSGYSAGDIVVFEDGGTEGGGAEGIIVHSGDEIILENDTAFDQYEYTAVAGQTTFGGVDSNGNTVRDINGKPTALNGLDIKVFIDGVEQSESIYETKLDRVTFIAPLDGSNNVISPTPSGGEKVEIVSRFSRLVQEDGGPIYVGIFRSKNQKSSCYKWWCRSMKKYQEFFQVVFFISMMSQVIQ